MPRMQGYNGDGEEMSGMYVAHEPVDYRDDTPSLTRQEFAEECDVNALMARYEKVGGMIPYAARGEPRYLDLTETPDLHTAMTIMAQAGEAFMSLPAQVRLRFGNDVEEFVKFAEDKDNLEQMREWGLAKPAEPPPSTVKVEVVNPQLGPEAAPAAAGTSP